MSATSRILLCFGAPVILAALTACAVAALAGPRDGRAVLQEQDVIRYTVRLAQPQTQTAEIVMDVPGVNSETLDVALPVWRPGRYVLIEPATTISHVRAESSDARPLEIRKIDKCTWRIDTRGADAVRLTYRVYANSLNDRTRHIDDTHAFLSPSAVFMYVPERRNQPLTVAVEAPAGWRTATGMREVEPGVFAAADYDVLVDSPLEIGLHDRHTFEVDGTPHEIVIWHAGVSVSPKPKYDAERMKRDFAAIVRAEAAIFGDMPYDRYVFLIHAGPGLSGGTEHLNSTIMQTSRAALEGSLGGRGAYKRFLGLVSHEMFHTWSVKRLRPADLKPYDYAHENYTRLLWFAEGATSYYDDLVLVRAGLMGANEYINVVEGLLEGQTNLVGWDAQSLEDSSFDAWVKFNKVWADSVNTTVSFYSKGSLMSLLLDMELRARTQNAVSLDTLMRRMYEKFPFDGPGFTTADLIQAASELAGSDFAQFFRDNIAGTARPDFAAALQVVGLECTSTPMTDEAYLGLSLTEKDGRTVVSSVLMGSPAYLAGLNADDEIIAMDARRLRSGDLRDRVEEKKPGDTVTFTFIRREEVRSVEVTLAEDPRRSWRVERVDEPTQAQREAFESWLGVEWDD